MRFCHLLVLLPAFTLTFAGGCGETQATGNGPATEPVQGKLIFTKGGDVKSLYDKQARIEFESVDQPGMRAVGTVEEDGTFTVATITPEGGSPGAVAGKHRVRLDLEENAQRLVAPQFLDAKKSGITVTVPSDEIKVEVWK